MDLPTAIDEFIGMLSLGSEALHRLAEREAEREPGVGIDASLDEIRSTAERLSAIANSLRRDANRLLG